jgi:hypothetical protein
MTRDIREAETYGSPVIDEPEWMRFLEEVEAEVERRKNVNSNRGV